jgi:hypothetical protein
LVIRKDDGEITTLNLDDNTVVEAQEAEPAATEEPKANEPDLTA